MDDLWRQLIGFVESFAEPRPEAAASPRCSTTRCSPRPTARLRPPGNCTTPGWAACWSTSSACSRWPTAWSRITPCCDRDLLLTGVILHDIGKLRELCWEIGFEYTVEGTLLGHIQMGMELVEKTIDSLPDFPPRLKTLVLHMILSHHGKLEFGSPKLPMIPEALVLNFLDDLDAKMQAMASEFEKSAREGKGPDELTGKVWALDQRQLLNTRGWLGEDGK